MESGQLIVTCPEQLDLLRRQSWRSRRAPVVLALPPNIDEGRRARLVQRINRELNACGCSEGTVAGLLYLILVPAFVMGRWVPYSVAGWALAVTGFIGALFLGKATGLLLARYRLHSALNRVERAMRRGSRGT